MQARFADGLFDGRRVVGDSTPTFGASVGHAIAVVGNVEKTNGGSSCGERDAGMLCLAGSERKRGHNRIDSLVVPPVDGFIVADCDGVVQ